jgi:hypothetical protein
MFEFIFELRLRLRRFELLFALMLAEFVFSVVAMFELLVLAVFVLAFLL